MGGSQPDNLIEAEPDPRDVAFLEDRIIEFNYASTGFRDGELLAIFEKNEGGEITAGIYGWTWGGTCEIRFLWVQASLRGRGIGSRLLAQAEAEALRRGCHLMVLDTHSFQAPDFYQKQGYRITGVCEDYPRGYQKFTLVKQLTGLDERKGLRTSRTKKETRPRAIVDREEDPGARGGQTASLSPPSGLRARQA